jgi:arginine decarboxylase
MKLRGKMERLYKELENYGKSDFYPFHMPGHKRNKACVEGDFPIERDITEIDGFDDLHYSEGILLEAQNALSRMYGTRKSFFSVNGSTAGLLTAISASVKKGGQILVARNCHKAVYHAIYLRELVPTYIYPQSDNDLGINGSISVSRVERCLEENPKIEAVLITSPTYDGVVSDVRKIAETAHRHGIPLIVDEAHGAHFRFSNYFPVSAADLGADVVIQSFHKTLPAMTQTAVLHLCSDRVSEKLLHRFLGIYQTSSPSYILMSSLDACVAKLEKESGRLFDEFTENLETARRQLGKCKYIRLVPAPGEKFQEEDDTAGTEAFDYDRSKLILSTLHSSLNGPVLAKRLRENYHLEVEMTTENYVLALAAVGDTREGFQRLCKAIEEIDRQEAVQAEKNKDVTTEIPVKNLGDASDPENQNCVKCNTNDCEGFDQKDNRSGDLRNGKSACKCGPMKQLMSISQAMDAPSQICLLEESVGKTAAEFVYIYPPGIPIIVPGEQITGLFTRNVRRYMEQGLNLHGLCGEKNETISVVKEQAEDQ